MDLSVHRPPESEVIESADGSLVVRFDGGAESSRHGDRKKKRHIET
jgi:hypothetical protein